MARILIIAACLCGLSQAQQPAQSQKNPFEPIPSPPPLATGPGVIEGIDFRGSRHFPQDTLRRTIFNKVGNAYSADAVRRDVLTLLNTERFEDVRVSTEQGEKGGIILHFVVTELPPAH